MAHECTYIFVFIKETPCCHEPVKNYASSYLRSFDTTEVAQKFAVINSKRYQLLPVT